MVGLRILLGVMPFSSLATLVNITVNTFFDIEPFLPIYAWRKSGIPGLHIYSVFSIVTLSSSGVLTRHTMLYPIASCDACCSRCASLIPDLSVNRWSLHHCLPANVLSMPDRQSNVSVFSRLQAMILWSFKILIAPVQRSRISKHSFTTSCFQT